MIGIEPAELNAGKCVVYWFHCHCSAVAGCAPMLSFRCSSAVVEKGFCAVDGNRGFMYSKLCGFRL